MKIVFLNTWGTTLQEKFSDFLNQNFKDTDVFCFQEATDKTIKISNNILKDFKLFQNYKYIDTEDTFPQATYVKNTIEVVNTETFLKDNFQTGLGLHTQIKYNDNLVNICNVHGISKPGSKIDTPGRIEQSKEIIKKYANLEGLKIIGGDFNLNIDTTSISIFETESYKNLIKDFNVTTTRNKYVWDLFPDNKQLFCDFVFCSKDVQIESFEAPNIEVSDHLPLILRVIIPKL